MVTGVQIHNWAEEFDGGEPNLEWVAPVNVYAVVDGKRYDIDLSRFPVRSLGHLMRPLAGAGTARDCHGMACN